MLSLSACALCGSLLIGAGGVSALTVVPGTPVATELGPWAAPLASSAPYVLTADLEKTVETPGVALDAPLPAGVAVLGTLLMVAALRGLSSSAGDRGAPRPNEAAYPPS